MAGTEYATAVVNNSRIGTAAGGWAGGCDVDITDWDKDDDFWAVLIADCRTHGGCAAVTMRLQWSNDGSSWNDLASGSGELRQSSGLSSPGTSGCDSPIDETGVVQSGNQYAFAATNAKDDLIELLVAVDASNAVDSTTYQFRLYDVTNSAALTVVAASLTTAAGVQTGYLDRDLSLDIEKTGYLDRSLSLDVEQIGYLDHNLSLDIEQTGYFDRDASLEVEQTGYFDQDLSLDVNFLGYFDRDLSLDVNFLGYFDRDLSLDVELSEQTAYLDRSLSLDVNFGPNYLDRSLSLDIEILPIVDITSDAADTNVYQMVRNDIGIPFILGEDNGNLILYEGNTANPTSFAANTVSTSWGGGGDEAGVCVGTYQGTEYVYVAYVGSGGDMRMKRSPSRNISWTDIGQIYATGNASPTMWFDSANEELGIHFLQGTRSCRFMRTTDNCSTWTTNIQTVTIAPTPYTYGTGVAYDNGYWYLSYSAYSQRYLYIKRWSTGSGLQWWDGDSWETVTAAADGMQAGPGYMGYGPQHVTCTDNMIMISHTSEDFKDSINAYTRGDWTSGWAAVGGMGYEGAGGGLSSHTHKSKTGEVDDIYLVGTSDVNDAAYREVWKTEYDYSGSSWGTWDLVIAHDTSDVCRYYASEQHAVLDWVSFAYRVYDSSATTYYMKYLVIEEGEYVGFDDVSLSLDLILTGYFDRSLSLDVEKTAYFDRDLVLDVELGVLTGYLDRDLSLDIEQTSYFDRDLTLDIEQTAYFDRDLSLDVNFLGYFDRDLSLEVELTSYFDRDLSLEVELTGYFDRDVLLDIELTSYFDRDLSLDIEQTSYFDRDLILDVELTTYFDRDLELDVNYLGYFDQDLTLDIEQTAYLDRDLSLDVNFLGYFDRDLTLDVEQTGYFDRDLVLDVESALSTGYLDRDLSLDIEQTSYFDRDLSLEVELTAYFDRDLSLDVNYLGYQDTNLSLDIELTGYEDKSLLLEVEQVGYLDRDLLLDVEYLGYYDQDLLLDIEIIAYFDRDLTLDINYLGYEDVDLSLDVNYLGYLDRSLVLDINYLGYEDLDLLLEIEQTSYFDQDLLLDVNYLGYFDRDVLLDIELTAYFDQDLSLDINYLGYLDRDLSLDLILTGYLDRDLLLDVIYIFFETDHEDRQLILNILKGRPLIGSLKKRLRSLIAGDDHDSTSVEKRQLTTTSEEGTMDD
jgi:hypothetical protein